jgi:DNA-binding Xre family transcriptional regulator
MDISKTFDCTLNSYGISGKWLASQSGVSEVVISRFRNGKQVYTDTLGKLLVALPFEAQKYFFESLLGERVGVRSPELREVVEEADSTQIANLLNAIASRISAPRKSTDEVKEKVLL